MNRSALLAFVLGVSGVAAAPPRETPRIAWPLRASVTGLNGKGTAFRAVTLGGELVMQVGEKSIRPLEPSVPVIKALARGDTLRAVAPASYPLDLARGAVVFFTSGIDSVQVVVGRNPFGMLHPVSARGRRITVRLVADSVVLESR